MNARNLVIVALACLAVNTASAADWITAPSYYTHDPATGQPTTQYAQIGPYYYYARPDYMKSGYRHLRSTIDVGNSSDSLHIVEEWGRPVRPYDEWRFPFRPYSVPYDAWGPPFGGLGNVRGVYPYGGFPRPYPYGAGYGGGFGGYVGGHGGPGHSGGPAVNYAQPWLDGHYPSYDSNDRSQYWRPYVAPQSHP